jgi:hypothetical protein
MFTLDKRDDGFMVTTADGRGVASVTCAKIEFKDDPRLKEPERVVTVLPRGEWQLHFCATKLTPVTLGKLLEALSTAEF